MKILYNLRFISDYILRKSWPNIIDPKEYTNIKQFDV